jgi:maltooligosyltrehalose trehalohydrolase
MLFMGEEWSEPNPFLYFVSHTDPELAAAVRKGRREEFAAFHAQGEAPDPVAEETFRRSKLQWQLLDEEKHQTLFGYYQRLIALRKSYPVWHHLHREHLRVEVDKAKNLLLLHRWLDDQYMVCLMNFSNTTQETVMPDDAKEWQKVLDAADTIWLGPKGASETVHAGNNIVIQPESILIYLSY